MIYEADRQKKESPNLGVKYSKEMRPLRNEAMNVCKMWTNTRCECPDDIRPMLEKYAKLQAIYHERGISQIPTNERSAYESLEAYRHSLMTYWSLEVNKQSLWEWLRGLPASDISYVRRAPYPSNAEMREFLTFHRAIYMTNNRATNSSNDNNTEPPIYKILRDELSRTDNNSYHSVVRYSVTIDSWLPWIREETLEGFSEPRSGIGPKRKHI